MYLRIGKQLGVTQEQIADYVGVSRAAVSKWEKDLVILILRYCQNLQRTLMCRLMSYLAMTAANEDELKSFTQN